MMYTACDPPTQSVAAWEVLEYWEYPQSKYLSREYTCMQLVHPQILVTIMAQAWSSLMQD